MDVRVINGKIQEMDMKSANTSVLRELGIISEQLYFDLIEGDKLTRNILIGKAMLNDDTFKIIDQEVKKYVEKFIAINHLKPNQILEIAKDAVFIYNATPKELRLGNYIQFRSKEMYFGMVEFSISETNSNKVKLYKRFAGVGIRGGKLDFNHVAYLTLQGIINAIMEKDSKRYIQLLRQLSKLLKSTNERLISNVENSYLIDVFKSISV